ncbi:MAG: hypothetical protein B6226_04615 [Candidatus Cloacimonetes bacterium 4572_65]|nr:MAG: hypothetical protein B6226_04615 [Candidatus Cloacimonetes bacterium 4572_65]
MKANNRKERKGTLNDKGFSLLELTAVLALFTIIFIGATLTISTFLIKFKELEKVSRLNAEAFNCIQVLKHGIHVQMPNEIQFMGIVNANDVELTGNYSNGGRSAIILKPPANSGDFSVNDQIKFYFSDGYVRYDKIVYGSEGTGSRDNYIFPKFVRGRNQDIEVTKLVFYPGNPISVDIIKIVKVELEARIEIIENKYHYVKYETYIGIGKM